jgi:hypothetical protein
MKNQKRFALSVVSLAALAIQVVMPTRVSAEPFKLNAQDSQVIPGQGTYQYPAPVTVTPPMQANVRSNTFSSGTQQNYTPPAPPPPRKPIQLHTQQIVSLPPGYLGVWQVNGMRQNIETANPDFAATAQTAFAPQTSNTWEISGSPGAYSMGNGSINTPFIVDRIGPDGTAFIRYQHPVGKTMAQEAIVLTLTNGGRSFNGLERISIVKEGEPPRAKVTYQLNGMRQR